MRILLISTNVCTEPYPVYPLGVSVIANALAKAGHEVVQYDILAFGKEGLDAVLREGGFGLVGLGIRNIDTVNSLTAGPELIGTSIETIRRCRALSDAPLCVGGAGFTLMPERIMEWSGADYGVPGEGEEVMTALANALAENRPPEKGLLRGGGGLPAQTEPLFDDRILDYYYRKTHIIPLQTKRGCPCSCVYCTYPKLEGRRVRPGAYAGVSSLVETYHARYPDAMFFFVDSVFNDPGKEYRNFLDGLHARCGRIPFDCFTTPWGLSREDISYLCSRGMISTSVGLDAATDLTLAGLGKNFTFSEAASSVSAMLAEKVGVSCSVMFGGPGETYGTIREGIANIRSLEPAYTEIFTGIRILPGTGLYDIAKAEGRVPPDWNGTDSLFFYENGLDPEKVSSMLEDGFRGSRYSIYPPGRMTKILRTVHRIGYVNLRKFTGADE